VTAYLEWADGATGTFVSTTAEAPDQPPIAARGRVVLENDRLVFAATRWTRSTQPHDDQRIRETDTWRIRFPSAMPPPSRAASAGLLDAILDGGSPLVPGGEGLHSIELANAMLYSSLVEQTITLPLDGAAYEARLNELIAGSSRQKKIVGAGADDFEKSFRR
jgi:hypothetical protein